MITHYSADRGDAVEMSIFRSGTPKMGIYVSLRPCFIGASEEGSEPIELELGAQTIVLIEEGEGVTVADEFRIDTALEGVRNDVMATYQDDRAGAVMRLVGAIPGAVGEIVHDKALFRSFADRHAALVPKRAKKAVAKKTAAKKGTEKKGEAEVQKASRKGKR